MEIKTPRVAVIIPCYNREQYIRETVASALSQTYPNLEVVAVDDGSTDGTRKILEDYSDRIRIMEHSGRVNKGQSASINLAMRSTDSEYVAILDSDDVWAPTKIERQAEILEKSGEVGLVYVNGFAIDHAGNRLYKLIGGHRTNAGDAQSVLLEYYIGPPSSWLVRRSAFESAGEFDEDMRSAQDHDMAIRLAEITKFEYIDEPLLYYRRHADTQSRKYSRRRWETGFVILKKACERYPYGRNVYRKRLAVLHFRLGQCLAEECRFLRAGGRFLIAGILDPSRALKVLLGLERLGTPRFK
jgi:glycosyltransferase involved in cell wall biosynthesis